MPKLLHGSQAFFSRDGFLGTNTGLHRLAPQGGYSIYFRDRSGPSLDRATPSGKWIGQVVQGALTFTPIDGGKSIGCARKPNTQEIFLGTGVLSSNPQFCAAINRHVLADPAVWKNAAKFYQAEPCNWYAKFFHEHSLDHKAYGFCYDDVSEQAAFFSGKGQKVIVTLYWDSKPPAKDGQRS
jgi:hypothetical protein